MDFLLKFSRKLHWVLQSGYAEAEYSKSDQTNKSTTEHENFKRLKTIIKINSSKFRNESSPQVFFWQMVVSEILESRTFAVEPGAQNRSRLFSLGTWPNVLHQEPCS